MKLEKDILDHKNQKGVKHTKNVALYLDKRSTSNKVIIK
jgi:hypothetical protein